MHRCVQDMALLLWLECLGDIKEERWSPQMIMECPEKRGLNFSSSVTSYNPMWHPTLLAGSAASAEKDYQMDKKQVLFGNFRNFDKIPTISSFIII